MLLAKTKKTLSNLLISDYLIILVTLFFIVYSFFSSNVPRAFGTEHYFMSLIVILAVSLYLIEIKRTDDFKYVETFGNENSNGNALYLIVKQWGELKK